MPVQPETQRAISRRADVDRREPTESRSFLDILTGPVARVLFALPFFVFGINHFAATDQMAATVPTFIPGTAVWVYVTGAAHLATSIAIMANRLIRPAGILLAVMLLAFVVTIHLPGLFGAETSATALTNLLKDTALAGGALMAAHVGQHDDTDA